MKFQLQSFLIGKQYLTNDHWIYLNLKYPHMHYCHPSTHTCTHTCLRNPSFLFIMPQLPPNTLTLPHNLTCTHTHIPLPTHFNHFITFELTVSMTVQSNDNWMMSEFFFTLYSTIYHLENRLAQPNVYLIHHNHFLMHPSTDQMHWAVSTTIWRRNWQELRKRWWMCLKNALCWWGSTRIWRRTAKRRRSMRSWRSNVWVLLHHWVHLSFISITLI